MHIALQVPHLLFPSPLQYFVGSTKDKDIDANLLLLCIANCFPAKATLLNDGVCEGTGKLKELRIQASVD
eukprot:1208793-Amphidinium_carterae.1